jgi:hypothetical protein
MRKILFLSVFIVLCLSVFAQQISEKAVVLNVEVPVRVFQGNTFIDDLTINDFEVFEDGKKQRIEAVYLIKKRSIERSEEKKRFAPDTVRNFYLFFELSEYTAKLGEAVYNFIHNVIDPGDLLTIVTPMKTYRLRGKVLEVKSREDITKQLKGLMRRDILLGNSEYRNSIRELSALARLMSATMNQDENMRFNVDLFTEEGNRENESFREQLIRYQELLSRLENLRKVDQGKLLDFAEYLRDREGQKYVFLFYQREYIPQIDPSILNQFLSLYQDSPDIQMNISNLFDFYKRDPLIDIERVKKVYADASISIHFLFFTPVVQKSLGVVFQERSEDIYSTFSQMARSTGGFIDSSANPDSLFKKAIYSSRNYYLLYYSPKNYMSDGKFKNINVRVKNKGYRIMHRVGYFAN